MKSNILAQHLLRNRTAIASINRTSEILKELFGYFVMNNGTYVFYKLEFCLRACGKTRTGPDRAGPGRAGRNRTGPDQTGPDRTGQPNTRV